MKHLKGELDISGDINETINQDAFEWHGSYDLKSEPCDFIEANSVSHEGGDLFFTLPEIIWHSIPLFFTLDRPVTKNSILKTVQNSKLPS